MASEKSYVSLFIKYLIFSINVFTWLMGLAVVVMCSYVLVQKDKMVRDAMDFFFDPACCLTLAGSVAVGLAMLGCMGSLRENTCLITSYHWIASLFLLLQLAGAILLFVLFYVPNAQKTLNLYPDKLLQKAIVKYRDDADLEDLINTMQKDLKCCGVSDDDEGYLNWGKNPYFYCNKSNPSVERCSVPASCCVRVKGKAINLMCGRGKQESTVTELNNEIYYKGCLKVIREWINSNAPLVGGIALGLLIPQMFFIYLARRLEDQIKAQRQRVIREPPRETR